jgi:hypothetical protein
VPGAFHSTDPPSITTGIACLVVNGRFLKILPFSGAISGPFVNTQRPSLPNGSPESLRSFPRSSAGVIHAFVTSQSRINPFSSSKWIVLSKLSVKRGIFLTSSYVEDILKTRGLLNSSLSDSLDNLTLHENEHKQDRNN